MELTAIKNALQKCHEKDIDKAVVNIDSKEVVDLLLSRRDASHLLIIGEIKELVVSMDIEFTLIQGHSGIRSIGPIS